MKPEYTQMEVCSLSKAWKVATLKQAAEVSSGINKPVGEMGTGALYVTVQDLYDGTSIRTSGLGRIRVTPAELERKSLAVGDIVFGKSSVKRDGIGYPSQFCGCAEPVVYSGFTYRARARQGTADPTFLFYALRSDGTRRWIVENSQSSALTNINQTIADAIPIKLPQSISEQRAIAKALSDMDALLGGLDQLIAKKRDLKQAGMQQLLTGQTRLSGFDGEWERKRIREFASCTAGGTPSTLIPEYWGGSIRWMNSGELHLKQVHDVEGRISEYGLLNSSAKILPTGCVLVGLAGQGKTRGTVAKNMVPLCTNQSIAGILPHSKFVSDYLYHNLDSRYDELRELSSGGGGRGGLNLTIIGSIEIPFPSVSEQRAIATVLSDMDAEIAALEARRDKTRDLKQGMMQELLTGRTRLI